MRHRCYHLLRVIPHPPPPLTSVLATLGLKNLDTAVMMELLETANDKEAWMVRLIYAHLLDTFLHKLKRILRTNISK